MSLQNPFHTEPLLNLRKSRRGEPTVPVGPCPTGPPPGTTPLLHSHSLCLHWTSGVATETTTHPCPAPDLSPRERVPESTPVRLEHSGTLVRIDGLTLTRLPVHPNVWGCPTHPNPVATTQNSRPRTLFRTRKKNDSGDRKGWTPGTPERQEFLA